MHLLGADKARSMINSNIKEAIENIEMEPLTFSMKKTLPLPRLSANIIIYKRQLWLYNCGIFAGKESLLLTYGLKTSGSRRPKSGFLFAYVYCK